MTNHFIINILIQVESQAISHSHRPWVYIIHSRGVFMLQMSIVSQKIKNLHQIMLNRWQICFDGKKNYGNKYTTFKLFIHPTGRESKIRHPIHEAAGTLIYASDSDKLIWSPVV